MDSPVSWNSKKENTVSLSSCEAEYMALSLTVQEAIYLATFLKDVLNRNITKVNIGVDNQGCDSPSKESNNIESF